MVIHFIVSDMVTFCETLYFNGTLFVHVHIKSKKIYCNVLAEFMSIKFWTGACQVASNTQSTQVCLLITAERMRGFDVDILQCVQSGSHFFPHGYIQNRVSCSQWNITDFSFLFNNLYLAITNQYTIWPEFTTLCERQIGNSRLSN